LGEHLSQFFDFLPDNWSSWEKDLWTDAFEPIGAFDDRVAQALFNEAYFNFDISTPERVAIRETLDDYMMREYGVDFDDIFDWQAWREAYGENA